MSLQHYYYTANQEEGHAYNCAWAAGGDCTCGKYAFEDWEEAPPAPPGRKTVNWLRAKLTEIQTKRRVENDEIPF
jgi:hypothetical protein